MEKPVRKRLRSGPEEMVTIRERAVWQPLPGINQIALIFGTQPAEEAMEPFQNDWRIHGPEPHCLRHQYEPHRNLVFPA